LPIAAAIPRSATAAIATRTPLYARGLRCRVPYFTTAMFTPQINAMRRSSRSVTVTPGRDTGTPRSGVRMLAVDDIVES
jgi:hypothetical protein